MWASEPTSVLQREQPRPQMFQLLKRGRKQPLTGGAGTDNLMIDFRSFNVFT